MKFRKLTPEEALVCLNVFLVGSMLIESNGDAEKVKEFGYVNLSVLYGLMANGFKVPEVNDLWAEARDHARLTDEIIENLVKAAEEGYKFKVL